jgi:hypothetical protein
VVEAPIKPMDSDNYVIVWNNVVGFAMGFGEPYGNVA